MHEKLYTITKYKFPNLTQHKFSKPTQKNIKKHVLFYLFCLVTKKYGISLYLNMNRVHYYNHTTKKRKLLIRQILKTISLPESQ